LGEFRVGSGEAAAGESGIVANGAASIDHGRQGTGSRVEGTGRGAW
jgi:hypothetical protein